MSILLDTDFAVGKYRIPLDENQELNLQSYIDDVEESYLPKLFGVELYDLFVADLAGTPSVPVSARFLQVFNPFIDQTNGCLTQSQGMKTMLKGFVYFLYIRDLIGKATTNGTKITVSENSVNISGVQYPIWNRYNDGIDNYKTIQNYMLNIDPDTYPEFAGVEQSYTSIF